MSWLPYYQTFHSKEELNRAVKKHLSENAHNMKEAERILFQLISRYAVKFPGAAHLKAATMAEHMGCSEKTIRRLLILLESKRMIKKIPTIRKVSGGKGANVIIIQSYDEKAEKCLEYTHNDQSELSSRTSAETSTATSNKPRNSSNETITSFKQKDPLKNLQDTAVPASVLSKKIPEEIFTAMSKYFSNDAEAMYSYYGLLLRAKASVAKDLRIEESPEPFIEAWHGVILKAKQGKVRSLNSYLYRAWQQAALTALRQKNPIFNWLES
ncbi:helix-turn-helix domain-containing protein [Jeotgalibacillus soli]|uniref:Helix-turn-helix domain-containing protein n=1 Tax=Jeotgalibacillus soli TaxID=889306 RepID=A0A0C2R4A1_9BACL|nr:helix-turn-helix domain-containing protein [Jeotgalibacillus soli]KIL45060.1 hypothetical protein KP78_26040 [Jeotgalibacillus soli]